MAGLISLFQLSGLEPSAPAPLPPLEVPPSLAVSLFKMFLPLAGYFALAPLLYWFFRATWQELDRAAVDHRRKTADEGTLDRRVPVVLVLTAVVLTLQEYYGGNDFYRTYVRTALLEAEFKQIFMPGGLGRFVHNEKWGDLYGYAFWAVTRVAGYTVVPFATWRLLFPKDSLLDMGLRLRGFRSHAWIYGLCLVVVLPIVFIVAKSPDFGSYYPFYKKCSRSWFDLLVWEGMYIAQFFALELFFRGFMLAALRRTFGSGAIFAMCVPYCMIHFGKPYLETCGAVVAGIALGSLSMKTKSIYSGFLVHVTVALAMDLLAIAYGGGLPRVFFPE